MKFMMILIILINYPLTDDAAVIKKSRDLNPFIKTRTIRVPDTPLYDTFIQCGKAATVVSRELGARKAMLQKFLSNWGMVDVKVTFTGLDRYALDCVQAPPLDDSDRLIADPLSNDHSLDPQ